MKIAVDFDDTIISQYDEVLKILNKRHNLNIDYNKVSYWNWTQDNYDEVTRDEIMDIVYNFKPQKCKAIDPHVAKYFNKIACKWTTDIVTARWGPPYMGYDIKDALNNLNLKYYHNIILCGKKYKQYMQYHLIIDDNPNLANGIIKDWKNGGLHTDRYPYVTKLILYDRPWNWSVECDKYPFLFRANDWKQVYKIVKSL